MDEITLTLNGPITDEQWDVITDVDFEHTNRIAFATKHGKNVEFVKQMRGKWIWMGDTGDSRWMCSVCKSKERVPTCNGEPTVWEYCPNCGARMESE